MRNRDGVSGRLRGASRSGLVRWNQDAIGATRIKALASTAIDSRTIEFDFTAGSETVLWDEPTPSKTDALAGVTDSQGNVYVTDGSAGVVKFNSAGRLLYKIALPVADPAHVVRALWVDESLRIFAGVSAGGDVRTARVFCILQLQDNAYHIAWTLEPGAYTEALRVYRGTQLFAAHNYSLERRARVVLYEGISIQPVVTRVTESVAYPIHDADVGADGSLYTASGPGFRTGGGNSLTRLGPGLQFSPPLEGWKPSDDPTINVWSHYRADEIDETDLDQGTRAVAARDDGQNLLRWRDVSGNNRHLYAGSLHITGELGPEYVNNGIGSRPSVRFDTIGTKLHSLATFGNASIDVNLAEQQRTMLPAYEGAMFAMFMVLRPSPDSDAGTPSPRVVMAMENEAAGPATDHVLFVNRDCKAALPGTVDAGFISHYAVTDNTGDAGQCAGPTPQSLGFDFTAVPNANHGTGAVLVTILWDGGVEPNNTAKTRSLVRYNGQPIDRFEGLPFTSLQPTWLGLAPATSFAAGVNDEGRFRGEIAEILVVDRRDRASNTEPKVLTYDDLETGDAPASQTDNQITRIEAYLAYRWGIGHVLPDPTDFDFPHPYGPSSAAGLLAGPPKPVAGGVFLAHTTLLAPAGLVAKHDAQGLLKWAESALTEGNGFGYGVRARTVESDGKTHVWSVGPDTGAGVASIQKMIDEGDSVSFAAGDGAWDYAFTAGRSLDYEFPRMATDKFGNMYLPYFETGAAPEWSLLAFKKDGVAGVGQVLVDFLLADDQQAHAVAIPPDALTPEYRGDLATDMAEHVYLFTENTGDPEIPTVHKLNLVQTDALTLGSPREVITLAVVEDDVRLVTESTNTLLGAAVIDGTAQFVQAFRAGEDIVIIDGSKILAYKLRDGTLAELQSESAGEIPPRPRYGVIWRHRLFLALEGGKYAASRLGNIRDWNLNPGMNIAGIPLQTASQAFTGTIVRAGEAADSLVTIIPVRDDLVYLVGESTILRLTGDPQSGGEIHLVTDSMGGVFGDSWCKDDRGRAFMWGNKPPGLYHLPEDADPEPLTSETLEATDFLEIDYATHRMLLAWDPIERGVRIWQVAWATSTVVAHWFWEERTHRLVKVPPIWQDRYASVAIQPTAVAYLAGDDTRGLLVGCEDGRIRRYDPAARDDDGTAIDSFIVFDLTAGMPPKMAARVTEIEIVLADDQEGCVAELFAGETGEALGPILDQVQLKPGRNCWRVRIKGSHIRLRLRNAATGRWSFEEGSYLIEAVGKVRQRQV